MKQKIFIKQEVLIEYDTPADRKEFLKDLKLYPDSYSIGGISHRFTKTSKPITFIFPRKAKN